MVLILGIILFASATALLMTFWAGRRFERRLLREAGTYTQIDPIAEIETLHAYGTPRGRHARSFEPSEYYPVPSGLIEPATEPLTITSFTREEQRWLNAMLGQHEDWADDGTQFVSKMHRDVTHPFPNGSGQLTLSQAETIS